MVVQLVTNQILSSVLGANTMVYLIEPKSIVRRAEDKQQLTREEELSAG